MSLFVPVVVLDHGALTPRNVLRALEEMPCKKFAEYALQYGYSPHEVTKHLRCGLKRKLNETQRLNHNSPEDSYLKEVEQINEQLRALNREYGLLIYFHFFP